MRVREGWDHSSPALKDGAFWPRNGNLEVSVLGLGRMSMIPYGIILLSFVAPPNCAFAMRAQSRSPIVRHDRRISVNARSVSAMDLLGPPVEAGRRADEVVLPLQGDTALGLRVFQLLDAGEMPVN